MLSSDYNRLAMGIDKLSREQAQRVIGSVLDQYKQLIGANVAAVWMRIPGKDRVDVLQPYVDRGDGQGRHPDPVSLTDKATGLFAWVVENNEPLWLSDIPVKATSLRNCLYPYQTLEGRHLDIYHRTRSFVAVPIEYKNHLLAVLAVEAPVPGKIKDFHVEALREIAKPTGVLIWKAEVFEDIKKEAEQIVEDFQFHIRAGPTTLNPYRTGFIARPYNMASSHMVSTAITDAFQKRQIKAAAYEHVPGSGLVMTEMLAQIGSCHFGLADITSLNANVIFELGALLAANKPVAILRDRNDTVTLPFDIAGYQCYRYHIEGNGIFIGDPQSLRRLDDFVESFVQEKLLANGDFQRAREWMSS
jgi:hypothetical protein